MSPVRPKPQWTPRCYQHLAAINTMASIINSPAFSATEDDLVKISGGATIRKLSADNYNSWKIKMEMILVEYAGVGVRCRLSGYRLSGYGLTLWLFWAAKVAYYEAIFSLFLSS